MKWWGSGIARMGWLGLLSPQGFPEVSWALCMGRCGVLMGLPIHSCLCLAPNWTHSWSSSNLMIWEVYHDFMGYTHMMAWQCHSVTLPWVPVGLATSLMWGGKWIIWFLLAFSEQGVDQCNLHPWRRQTQKASCKGAATRCRYLAVLFDLWST